MKLSPIIYLDERLQLTAGLIQFTCLLAGKGEIVPIAVAVGIESLSPTQVGNSSH